MTNELPLLLQISIVARLKIASGNNEPLPVVACRDKSQQNRSVNDLQDIKASLSPSPPPPLTMEKKSTSIQLLTRQNAICLDSQEAMRSYFRFGRLGSLDRLVTWSIEVDIRLVAAFHRAEKLRDEAVAAGAAIPWPFHKAWHKVRLGRVAT